MKTPVSQQKLRGGYYTPSSIALFLSDWAIRSPTDLVLEPSCGDGEIIEAAVQTLLSRGAAPNHIPRLVEASEIDVREAQKAADRFESLTAPQIHCGDFFAFCEQALWVGKKFNAVIGNPPFIRYQNFQESQRVRAFEIMRMGGLNPTRLTNAWVPFVVASTLLLNERGGRIAMVIPAEILQVGYAAELRRFLSDKYDQITLIAFDKLVFEGIQQEVVLLLGERHPNPKSNIRTLELRNASDLLAYQQPDKNQLKEMDHSREKWTQYFLDHHELGLLRELRQETKLTLSGEVLDVDVGIVTGLNEFFVMSEETARDKNLFEFTQPIVTRSSHLRGMVFSEEDLSNNTKNGYLTRLLLIPNQPYDRLPQCLKDYIGFGEQNNYHQGYKCRIRKNWYVVPSVWRPDGFMLRQIHLYPKIIANCTAATSTDTIHRVRFKGALPGSQIATAFFNSLSFLFSEVVGRSYGGGVLELEPSEAELIPLPLQGSQAIDPEEIDLLIRSGNAEIALKITNKVLLSKYLGLNSNEIKCLDSAWRKLRDRRINRNHARKAEVV